MNRNDVIAAPVIAGVVGLMTLLVFRSVISTGLSDEFVLGISIGTFISMMAAVIISAALFGELLANALESDK